MALDQEPCAAAAAGAHLEDVAAREPERSGDLLVELRPRAEERARMGDGDRREAEVQERDLAAGIVARQEVVERANEPPANAGWQEQLSETLR